MAGRRGHGEGSISQRADGRWQVQLDLGRGTDGRRRRKTAYAPMQADAVRALKRLAGRAVEGQLLTTSTPTVSTYLDEWFRTNCDAWRPSTRRCYRAAVDTFLVPAFGTLPLEQLTPQRIQRWLLEQKEAHGARRRITLAHAALRSALADAQRLQLVSINAATLVKVPRVTTSPSVSLDVAQATAFLKVAGTHRLGALFGVALACGLRLGEATGLRWEDADLTTGEVRVGQQLQRVGKRLELQELKTAKSRRTLALPETCLEALRAHRTRQLEERLKAGPEWIDSGLVFTTYGQLARANHNPNRARRAQTAGGPLQPRNVLRTLHALLDVAGLPRVRFHDLRHSAASLLIAAGVEFVEVSMLLGHSELRVTADLYSHLQKQTAAKAARHMDALLGSGG